MTVERRGWSAHLLTLWLPLGVSLVFALFPFYWMAITSLKSNQELYNRKIMPLIVHHPTLKHYVDLITETSFLQWTWNTFLVAVVSTAISLLFGAMLAYPLARMRFAGATLVSFAIAATYLVPQPLLFVPLADLINRLGLGDTLTSVILTYPTLLVPFCARVKAKIPAEMKPGPHSGRTILTRVCSRLAPSMRAASSSSIGTVRK